MNAAVLPQGLQQPLGEQSSDFGDDFAGGRSLDMEIVLDQVADLLTGSSARASSPLQ